MVRCGPTDELSSGQDQGTNVPQSSPLAVRLFCLRIDRSAFFRAHVLFWYRHAIECILLS